MMKILNRLLAIVLIFSARATWASFCAQWSPPTQIALLPRNPLNEVSGMVASKAISNRVYWINDSGDKGYLYYSNAEAEKKPDIHKTVSKVKIKDYKARDSEAISLTECPEGPCLAIGDIGDNNSRRKEVEIVFVLEKLDFGSDTSVLRRLKLKYPNGAHDAEALAFLPNGDLLIITKEIHYLSFSTRPAQVFMLSKKKWQAAAGETVTLDKVGEIDLETLLPEENIFSHVVTDVAISVRRQVAIVLTYGKAIEIQLGKFSDLGQSSEWKINRDYTVVNLQPLSQQESITYLPEKDQILWSTEYVPPNAPVYSMTCERAVP
jgi:hypothetical protein